MKKMYINFILYVFDKYDIDCVPYISYRNLKKNKEKFRNIESKMARIEDLEELDETELRQIVEDLNKRFGGKDEILTYLYKYMDNDEYSYNWLYVVGFAAAYKSLGKDIGEINDILKKGKW